MPDEPLALDFHRTMARVALIMVLSTEEFVPILDDLVKRFDTDDDTLPATEWTRRWRLEAPWLVAWALAQRKAVRAGALLDPTRNMTELLLTPPADYTVLAASLPRSNLSGGWLEWFHMQQQSDTALQPLLANPMESETAFLARAKAHYRAHAAAAAKFGIRREHPNSRIYRDVWNLVRHRILKHLKADIGRDTRMQWTKLNRALSRTAVLLDLAPETPPRTRKR